MNKYSDEIRAFIKNNHKGNGPTAMAELVNKTFGTDYTKSQMKSFYSNNKLNSGVTGRFEKGHIPVNHRSIGSERIDSKDGYILVKVAEPNTWKHKHRVLWEENNGPIPKGYVVIFKDGNKKNITLENLALVSRAEHLELTRSHLRSSNPELTQTGITVAKIRTIARQRK